MPNVNSDFPNKESFQSAPTQPLVVKWLWKRYGIFVSIEVDLDLPNDSEDLIFIISIDGEFYHKEGEWHYDPEQALEQGIKKVCEHLKSKNHEY
jgi:hypothetical protein